MNKFNNMLSTTMETIASDLQELVQESGDTLTAEELAQSSFDTLYIHSDAPQELQHEFEALGYDEMMKIALPIANEYI